MKTDEELQLLEAMRRYGGSFASHLADAWAHADDTNDAILRDGFHHLRESYRQFLPPKPKPEPKHMSPLGSPSPGKNELRSSSQVAWLDQHGQLIIDELRRLDPSLYCWWERHASAVVVSIGPNLEVWFTIMDDEPFWIGDRSTPEGGFVGRISTDINYGNSDEHLIAQGLFKAVKHQQGRV